MSQYVPQVINDSEEFNIFLKIIKEVSDDIRNLIISFPEIVDIDNAPELFLPKLSYLLGYSYDYSIDIDVQREIIQRLIEIYKSRGTDESIIMAATYGSDSKWAGDHLFLPGATKTQDKASITYPVTNLFRHDISEFSSNNVYANGELWREGTLLISVSYIDQKIIDAVAKVLPAGLKVYFQVDTVIIDPDTKYGAVSFGEWTVHGFTDIDIDLIYPTMRRDLAIRSNASKGLRDSVYLFSGESNIDPVVSLVYNRLITPSDDSYPTSEVEDLTYNDHRNFIGSHLIIELTDR
jgi:phage tail-like protein